MVLFNILLVLDVVDALLEILEAEVSGLLSACLAYSVLNISASYLASIPSILE
jgi:hypothetical protein